MVGQPGLDDLVEHAERQRARAPAEWNALTSNASPWRASASARIRWISTQPTMYDVARPGLTM